MVDDLATPLFDVKFVVLDLETTGTSPTVDRITEVGALAVCGGEVGSRVDTLVNPGVPIPRMITVLTGITEAMLLPAPSIERVLPSLLELLRGAVIVGHNIRFDCAFLDAALVRNGYPRLSNRRVDTIALARRLMPEEVPNLRLHTLAMHLRAPTEPVHRAYADAAATTEVFHSLLERAASFGVFGLDDLVAVPRMRPHPSSAKLALTADLPRAPGVYVLRDRNRRVLYAGATQNLRARVRAYFAGDPRRTVPQLVRETAHVDHRVCGGPFEAAVRQVRLIHRFRPRFNREVEAWRRYAYVKTAGGRLGVTRRRPADGEWVLGPFSDANAARVARDAIESSAPTREQAIALARAVRRRETIESLRQTQHLVLDTPEGHVELQHGIPAFVDRDTLDPTEEVDVLLAVARWLSERGRQTTTRGEPAPVPRPVRAPAGAGAGQHAANAGATAASR